MQGLGLHSQDLESSPRIDSQTLAMSVEMKICRFTLTNFHAVARQRFYGHMTVFLTRPPSVMTYLSELKSNSLTEMAYCSA